MGVFGDGGNANKGKRKPVEPAALLSGLFPDRKNSTEVDWGDAMPELVSALVCSVTRAGGLVSFGRARNLGALSVTVMVDNDRKTIWVNPNENIDEVIEKCVHYFDALPR